MEEAVEAVARALGVDDAAIARRKAFLEFTDNDVARLRTLHEALRTLAPDFANAFYDHLLAFPALILLIAAVFGDGLLYAYRAYGPGGPL